MEIWKQEDYENFKNYITKDLQLIGGMLLSGEKVAGMLLHALSAKER